VEVLHDNADEHVENEEADEEKKRNEVNQSPFVEIFTWLKEKLSIELIRNPSF
jgi:hypothetical protein